MIVAILMGKDSTTIQASEVTLKIPLVTSFQNIYKT